MKKIALLCILALPISLSSCKKEKAITPIPSITLTSPLGNQTFSAGEYIDVKWKSSNLPAGSVILASVVNHIGNGLIGFYIIPQTGRPVRLPNTGTLAEDGYTYVSTTPDDGEEVFQLPQDTSAIYHHGNYTYGTSFTLTLVAVFPSSDGTWTTLTDEHQDIEVESKDFFTILPSGCSSTTGYSTTTGQSCNVPFK